MALILHIDTALETATICFANKGQILATATNENQKDHAAFLQVAIQNLAKENSIDLKNIDAVAVTIGPGSYTGLRVGLASAKGICYALDKPLITVTTLKILASTAIETYKNDAANNNLLICPMIDARRMEVFTAVYNYQLKEVIAPHAHILTPNSFEELLSKNHILFIGNGAKKINVVNKHFEILSHTVESTTKIFSYLSYQTYVNQEFSNLAYTEPFYIKPFVDTPKF
jgi:tRNA threonylcarbamoyladenosine biosynthesis protein TsaB